MLRTLRAGALGVVLALGTAAAGLADQLAPQPEPTPTATIAVGSHCEHSEGPGTAFQTSLDPEPEDGNQVAPLVRYRPTGGVEATTVSGPSGYMQSGVGDFEVQAVYHQPPFVQQGAINPIVHPGGTWASDSVPVTVTCAAPAADPEPATPAAPTVPEASEPAPRSSQPLNPGSRSRPPTSPRRAPANPLAPAS